jgi:hypothetical protein
VLDLGLFLPAWVADDQAEDFACLGVFSTVWLGWTVLGFWQTRSCPNSFWNGLEQVLVWQGL